MWEPNDILALDQLLSKGSKSEDKDFGTKKIKDAATPGSIGPQYNHDPDKTKSKLESNFATYELDSRLRPEYEFIYKQAVTPNDIYLQMGDKNPSTTSCEDLLMKIHLPDTESASDLKLDVQPTYIKLSSPIYILALHLPHKVDVERSSAKWDPDISTLIVSMPIVERDLLSL